MLDIKVGFSPLRNRGDNFFVHAFRSLLQKIGQTLNQRPKCTNLHAFGYWQKACFCLSKIRAKKVFNNEEVFGIIPNKQQKGSGF